MTVSFVSSFIQLFPVILSNMKLILFMHLQITSGDESFARPEQNR